MTGLTVTAGGGTPCDATSLSNASNASIPNEIAHEVELPWPVIKLVPEVTRLFRQARVIVEGHLVPDSLCLFFNFVTPAARKFDSTQV
jgi:hypothetical protein